VRAQWQAQVRRQAVERGETGVLGATMVDPMQSSCTCSMIACWCGWTNGCASGCGWSSRSSGILRDRWWCTKYQVEMRRRVRVGEEATAKPCGRGRTKWDVSSATQVISDGEILPRYARGDSQVHDGSLLIVVVVEFKHHLRLVTGVGSVPESLNGSDRSRSRA
jgi:hypothetical protein